MARRRSLPFVAVEGRSSENYPCNVLLRCTVASAVDSAQHALCPRALLASYPCVRRDGAAVDFREQTMDGLEPVETIEVERYNCGDWHRAGREQLNLLAITKLKNGMDALLVDFFRIDRERRLTVFALDEDVWRRGQDNDTRIVLRQPED